MRKRYYTYEAHAEGVVSPRAAAAFARAAEPSARPAEHEQGGSERASKAAHASRSHACAASRSERPRAQAAARYAAPSKLTRLYESRDRQLVVLEDARGHVAAVKAARLA